MSDPGYDVHERLRTSVGEFFRSLEETLEKLQQSGKDLEAPYLRLDHINQHLRPALIEEMDLAHGDPDRDGVSRLGRVLSRVAGQSGLATTGRAATPYRRLHAAHRDLDHSVDAVQEWEQARRSPYAGTGATKAAPAPPPPQASPAPGPPAIFFPDLGHLAAANPSDYLGSTETRIAFLQGAEDCLKAHMSPSVPPSLAAALAGVVDAVYVAPNPEATLEQLYQIVGLRRSAVGRLQPAPAGAGQSNGGA
jgi:hypothetical protein